MGLLGDFLEEMGELLTDGFVEMVFKDNITYQTSKEKRDSAESIVKKSQRFENDSFEAFRRQLGATQRSVKLHQDLCQSIVRERLIPWGYLASRCPSLLAEEVISGLRQRFSWLRFLPPEKLIRYGADIEVEAEGLTSPSYDAPLLQSTLKLVTGLGIISSYMRHERVVASSKYLEDAKDYAAAVDAQCLGRRVRVTELSLIRQRLRESRLLLSSFASMLVDALATSGRVPEFRQFQLGSIAAGSIVAIIEQPIVDEEGALVKMNDSLLADLLEAQAGLGARENAV